MNSFIWIYVLSLLILIRKELLTRSECVDKDSSCALKIEDCKSNIAYINENCSRTCGICDLRSNEKRLKDHIFSHYDKHIKPKSNSSDTVSIEFSLSLIEIFNVDDKSKKAEISCWINLQWSDDHLYWDASQFGGVKAIRVKSELIWQPDIFLYNSADFQRSSLKDACAVTNVVLYPTMMLIFVPPCKFMVSFKEQFEYYPYDEITMFLKFGSWTHDDSDISLDLGSYGFNMDDYKENSDWKLISTNIKKNVKQYPCCPESYSDLTANITLQRRPHFYGITLIMNNVVTAMIILFMFFMPPENISRLIILGINLGVLTLQLLFLVYYIPSLLKIPIIVKCSALLSLLNTLTIGLFVLLYRLSSRGCTSNVPECLSNYLINMIGRILCIDKTKKTENIDSILHREVRADSISDDKVSSLENSNQEVEMKNRQQWYTIALILNRVFLILIVFIVVVTLLALLV